MCVYVCVHVGGLFLGGHSRVQDNFSSDYMNWLSVASRDEACWPPSFTLHPLNPPRPRSSSPQAVSILAGLETNTTPRPTIGWAQGRLQCCFQTEWDFSDAVGKMRVEEGVNCKTRWEWASHKYTLGYRHTPVSQCTPLALWGLPFSQSPFTAHMHMYPVWIY